MNSFKKNIAVLFMFLMLPQLANADQNDEVAVWAAKTLLITLSLSNGQNRADLEKIKKSYSYNAWSGLISFLGQQRNTVQSEKITPHPVLDGRPVVVKTGVASGIQFWKINQNVIFPGLNIKVAFTLTVLARNPNANIPYLIYSMDMVLLPNQN